MGDIMQGVESIPAWLGDYLGITTASAQALLSLIVILAVLLPTIYLAQSGKSKSNHTIVYVAFLSITSIFLVGIQWMPFWVLIMEVSAFALVYALLGSNAVGG